MRGNATAHRNKGGRRRNQTFGSQSTSSPRWLRWAFQASRLRRLAKLCCEAALLLPGALLVAIGAQLLAPFVLIDFGFPAFF